MKTYLFCFIFIFSISTTFAQPGNTEEENIKATINALFDGMRKSDTALAHSAFAGTAIMQSVGKTREGKTILRNESPSKFVASLAGTHPVYDERIQFTKILIDGELASVWTNYKFYLGDKFSHCGVNSFQLMKTDKGWKIIYLIDTRRQAPCN